MEIIEKIRQLALDIKAKVTGEQFYTFEQAVKLLKDDLKFSEDKAQHFVRRFDKNKDGKLSVQEFDHFKNKLAETKALVVPAFKQYDRDDNGYITLEEASQLLMKGPFYFPANNVVKLLKLFDTDGNGKLDIEEFAAFFANVKAINEDLAHEFDKLDKDGNGVLSPDEVEEIFKKEMNWDKETARSMVQMFDQNQDGSLDKQEFMQMWSSMFGSKHTGF